MHAHSNPNRLHSWTQTSTFRYIFILPVEFMPRSLVHLSHRLYGCIGFICLVGCIRFTGRLVLLAPVAALVAVLKLVALAALALSIAVVALVALVALIPMVASVALLVLLFVRVLVGVLHSVRLSLSISL